MSSFLNSSRNMKSLKPRIQRIRNESAVRLLNGRY